MTPKSVYAIVAPVKEQGDIFTVKCKKNRKMANVWDIPKDIQRQLQDGSLVLKGFGYEVK